MARWIWVRERSAFRFGYTYSRYSRVLEINLGPVTLARIPEPPTTDW